jgi:hypothetical protein
MEQRHAPVRCPRCSYQFSVWIDKGETKKAIMKRERKIDRLPHNYIDDLPVLIADKKVDCPSCNNTYRSPVTIEKDGDTGCISICPTCHHKIYIYYNKKINKFIKKKLDTYYCDSIDELKQHFKKNIGWKKLFYPGYFWETYERVVLPYQKTPDEQAMLFQKHDYNAREGIDYNDFILTYYYRGNVDNPIIIHTREGKPVLIKDENILNKIEDSRCYIVRLNDKWGWILNIEWKYLNPIYWESEDFYDNEPVKFMPINIGSIFKTNERLIHLVQSSTHGQDPGSEAYGHIIANSWAAAYNRQELKRMDGFSIPLDLIVGCIKKRKLVYIYFKNRNNEKFRLNITQKQGNYEIIEDIVSLNSKKELPLD